MKSHRLSALPQWLRHAASGPMRGVIAHSHNAMAVVGVMVAALALVLLVPSPLRASTEQRLLDWLSDRSLPSQALERVTAVDVAELPEEQARLAEWLSRKYRVAPAPLGALVSEAYAISKPLRLDPKLILAVMAVESRFNPFAASPVGAHGLMQVMTHVHSDKYADFGGQLAAFDPVSNMRVGAEILRETIRRAGSTEGGLRLYVGAVSSDGRDYIDKVLSELDRLHRVADGQRVAFNAFQRQTPASTETELLDSGANADGTGLTTSAS
jgi:hypothetical protein